METSIGSWSGNDTPGIVAFALNWKMEAWMTPEPGNIIDELGRQNKNTGRLDGLTTGNDESACSGNVSIPSGFNRPLYTCIPMIMNHFEREDQI